MTVLLVLFTLLIFLGIDYLLHRQQQTTVNETVRKPVAPSFLTLPENTILTNNHTWLRQETDGVITLGLDRFLTRVTGRLKEIVLPVEGSIVTHATSDITLAENGKCMAIESPVVGRVVAVNHDLMDNPNLLHDDPYNNGWLMKIRLIPDLDRSRDFLVERPAEWLRDQFERAARFFEPRNADLGIITMQDGGELIDGPLAGAAPEVWSEFKTKFASLSSVEPGQRAEQ